MTQQGLLDIHEVCQLTGMGRSSIHYRVGRGEFPEPVVIRPRAHFWSVRQVKAYLEGRDWEKVPA